MRKYEIPYFHEAGVSTIVFVEAPNGLHFSSLIHFPASLHGNCLGIYRLEQQAKRWFQLNYFDVLEMLIEDYFGALERRCGFGPPPRAPIIKFGKE